MKIIATTLKALIFLYIVLLIAPSLQHKLTKTYTTFIEPHTRIGTLSLKGDFLEAQGVVGTLSALYKDTTIKGIILTIESNGGAAGTIQTIIHELEHLKLVHPKPLVCVTENYCTAGAYALACCADYFIAPESALIGGLCPQAPNSSIMNPDQLSLFDKIILKHRAHLTPAVIIQLSQGALFTGQQALKERLIDHVGSPSDAIAYLKKHIVINGHLVLVKKPHKKNLFKTLSLELTKALQQCNQTYYNSLRTTLLQIGAPLWSR